ncbi:MAG TPA: TrmH family RNA methyltransferase [Natronosporangium sp.]
MPQIGLQHPRVKQVRAVLHHRGPQHRQLLVAEGLWAHNLLLRQDAAIELFLWAPGAAYGSEAHVRARELAGRARSAYQISAKVLARLTERDRPDGLLSLVRLPEWRPDAVPLRPRAVVLVADGIEIPGNLGTVLRTLDACGGAGLLLTNRRTRLTHPKVFRGSRGMNLRVPVLEFEQPAEAADWLLDNGFTVYLATTGPAAVPYWDVDYPDRTAIVVGNERYGISRPWLELGFPEVTVPMRGVADSLNVSVSASILLYQAVSRS